MCEGGGKKGGRAYVWLSELASERERERVSE